MGSLVQAYRRKLYLKQYADGGGIDWTGVNVPNSINNGTFQEQLPSYTGDEIDYTRSNVGMTGMNPRAGQIPNYKPEITGESVNIGDQSEWATQAEDNASYSRASKYGQAAFQASGAAFLAVQESRQNPASNHRPDGYYQTNTAAKDAMKGASYGATIGSAFGPVGTLVGGAIGAVGGGVYGYARGSKMAKEANQQETTQDRLFKRQRQLEMQAVQMQNPDFATGRSSQMYGKGGSLPKEVPLSTYKPTPVQWPAATTEYLEPNTPGIQLKPIANTLVQTLGDQYLGGKALNMYNTYSDFLKKKSLGTATNVALEHVKLSTPVLGDLATNYIQEGVSSYDAPEVKFGLPGNAQQVPPLYQKAVKAKPHYNVPTSSSTYVKKPLIRGKGGTLSGNFLANQKAVGGSMQPMSKDTTVAVGPSHAQGGIELPNQGANVEGGETTSGNFVFSKQLGFAQIHKPIARAQGKIENKPATAERMEALQRLDERTQQLKSLQEGYKQRLNIQ